MTALELKEKLKNQPLDELRKLVTALDSDFFKINPQEKKTSKLNDWIKENKNLNKKSRLTNISYYHWIQKKASENIDEILKKDGDEGRVSLAIEIIIYIYYEKCSIRPEFWVKDGVEKINFIKEDNKLHEYKVKWIRVEKVIPRTVGANYYLFYYWRDTSSKEKEHLDRGIIEVYNNWEKAKLYLIYPNPKSGSLKNYSLEYEGTAIKPDSEHHLGCISFIQQPNKETKFLNIFTILFYSDSNLTSRNYLPVAYTKLHQSKRFPTSGIGYLEKINSANNLKDVENYLEKNKVIHPSIYYQLYRKRLLIPHGEVLIKDTDIKTLCINPISKLDELSGIYKGIMFYSPLSGNTSLITFYLKLCKNGYVEVFTKLKPEGHTGQCKVTDDKDFKSRDLLIEFDYRKELDIYNSKFILRADLEDNKYLYGISVVDGSTRATKVRFERIEVSDIVNLKDNLEKKYKTESLPIKIKDEVNKEVIKKLNSDANLKDFLLVTGKKHSRYTDGFVSEELKQSFENQIVSDLIIDKYDCYSFTLDGNKEIQNYTEKEALIWRYPIEIFSNGCVQITTHRGTFIGKLAEDQSYFSFSIFETSLRLHAIFRKSELEDKEKINRLYGVLVRVNEGNPEGRVCVLIKEKVSTNSLKISIDSNEFHKTDAETFGVLSFLRGAVNRIVRSPKNDQNVFKPRTGKNSMKRDIFYSACYLASQNKIEDCISRLRMAYINGFAQDKFINLVIPNSNTKEEIDKLKQFSEQIQPSIQKIIEERMELVNVVINGPLNNPEIKEEVKRLWNISIP